MNIFYLIPEKIPNSGYLIQLDKECNLIFYKLMILKMFLFTTVCLIWNET